jgi:hypothetical protein
MERTKISEKLASSFFMSFNPKNVESSVFLNIYTCLQNIHKQCVVFIPNNFHVFIKNHLFCILISPPCTRQLQGEQ